MERFFFHLTSGNTVKDEEGEERSGAALASGAQCFVVSPDWWSVSSI